MFYLSLYFRARLVYLDHLGYSLKHLFNC